MWNAVVRRPRVRRPKLRAGRGGSIHGDKRNSGSFRSPLMTSALTLNSDRTGGSRGSATSISEFGHVRRRRVWMLCERFLVGLDGLQQRPDDPVVHLTDIVFLARVRLDVEHLGV